VRGVVIVLGDLVRSPRAVLHATAMARAGATVHLVGFAELGWRPFGAPAELRVWPLSDRQRGDHAARNRLPYTLTAAWRAFGLLLELLWLVLWRIPRTDVILVQNPPGVPTLAVAWLTARIRRSRLVIDWHNLTWAMLTMRVSPRHPLVTAVSAYERFFGRRADLNLFVSRAMQVTLSQRWGMRGVVFRDRPSQAFQIESEAERRAIRTRLLERLGEPPGSALVVSSTSWSADEDFDLLFEALTRYDAGSKDPAYVRQEAHAGSRHPTGAGEGLARLVVLITGQGPLRADFEKRCSEAHFRSVGVHTAWLESGEYTRVLAAADLGVCLHRSASGLDLPMKVLDMFGAGLPVCALDYGPCLAELVQHGINGLLFRTSDELAGQLRTTLATYPDFSPTVDGLRAGVLQSRVGTWEDSWKNGVWPSLERIAGSQPL